MAAILASNVSYAIVYPMRKFESGERQNRVDMTFGNGSLTYPALGIPLTKGQLGVPNTISEIELDNPSASDGYVYKHDSTNGTIRIYQAPASGPGPLVELTTAATPAATTLRLAVRGW